MGSSRVVDGFCRVAELSSISSLLYADCGPVFIVATLHCAALHCTALHCAALRCTALHCAARYGNTH